MPLRFLKSNATHELPAEVLLRMWFAQFWRFAVLMMAGFFFMFCAATLTFIVLDLTTGEMPPSRRMAGTILYGLFPLAIWAWIRAFCSVLNRNYGGYRITITRSAD